MFVVVEPAEFFMHRVKLIFDVETPDSEDTEVREYLQQWELEPKYLFDDELEGRKCQVMQFGGCYLGRHLDELSKIQRKAVEVEVLTSEIEGHLDGLEVEGACLSQEAVKSTATALAPRFNEDSAFQANEDGELIAVLDRETVIAAAREHIASNGSPG